MKNKIIVLVMALVIVGLTAGSAAASDWEAVGGVAITNVTLDKWNSTIDDLNTNFFNESNPGTTNVEEMDNIDRVPMIYLGTKKEFKQNWVGSLRYEYIFGGVEGSANIGGDDHTAETDVKLHGLALLADYNLNNRWNIGGGVGFYKGTKNKDIQGPVFTGYGLAEDTDYDLDAVNYRLGVGYERSFAANWDFNAGLDYLYMEIDDEEEGNVYSKGFSYNLGLTYHF
ncbi:MAG: outer membrane protein [Halanaerobiales bacterium]